MTRARRGDTEGIVVAPAGRARVPFKILGLVHGHFDEGQAVNAGIAVDVPADDILATLRAALVSGLEQVVAEQ